MVPKYTCATQCTLLLFGISTLINYAICTNYNFSYRMLFKGMLVIYVAVLTVAAAKDAKGKYLKFTDNL